MIKRHLGALLSIASMGGGELMEFDPDFQDFLAGKRG